MSPRGRASGVATDFQSDRPKPVVLVDLATGGSPANLRMTRRGEPIVFAGVTFSRRLFELDVAKVQASTSASTLQLRVDDTDGAIHALHAAGADFLGQRATIYRTNVGSTGGSGSDGDKEVYLVDSWDRLGTGWSFVLKPLSAVFDEEVPRQVFTKDAFPGIPSEAG